MNIVESILIQREVNRTVESKIIIESIDEKFKNSYQ